MKLGVAAAMTLVFCCSVARATPEFPQAVDSYLMLPDQIEKAFPQSGCLLCHLSESPPLTNPPMKPFGSLLFARGALPYNPDSLAAALRTVAMTTPSLITDLQQGKDPNQNGSAPHAPPAPEYGCSMTATGGYPTSAWYPAMSLLVAAAWQRARRLRVIQTTNAR